MTPLDGEQARPALLGTVRPRTRSSLTWKKQKKWWLGKKCQVIVDVKLRFERLNRLLVGQLGLHQLENVQMGE